MGTIKPDAAWTVQSLDARHLKRPAAATKVTPLGIVTRTSRHYDTDQFRFIKTKVLWV